MTDEQMLAEIAAWRKNTLLRDQVAALVLIALLEDELMKRCGIEPQAVPA